MRNNWVGVFFQNKKIRMTLGGWKCGEECVIYIEGNEGTEIINKSIGEGT